MISLIACMSDNQVIGLNNDMPWHLPNDLKYFREQTKGKTVVMGKNTYLSLGRALPDRTNIVLTSSTDKIEGVVVYNSFEKLLKSMITSQEELFVIGGAKVYQLFLPYADKLYLTKIRYSFDGDTFFPEISPKWMLKSTINGVTDEKNVYEHSFNIYEHK